MTIVKSLAVAANRICRTIARLLTPWRTIRQLESKVERLEGIIRWTGCASGQGAGL